jgi:hypothetical protein
MNVPFFAYVPYSMAVWYVPLVGCVLFSQAHMVKLLWLLILVLFTSTLYLAPLKLTALPFLPLVHWLVVFSVQLGLLLMLLYAVVPLFSLKFQ